MEKFGINKGHIHKYIITVKKCKHHLDKVCVGARLSEPSFYYGPEFKYCFYFNDSMSFVHGFPMGPPPLIHLFSVQSDTRTYLWSCVKASDLMLLSHGGYVYRRVKSCDLQTSTIPESPPSIMYCPSRLSIIVYKTQRNSIVTYHCKDKTDRHVPYSLNHKIEIVNHPLIQSVH